MLDRRDIQTLMYCVRIAETAGQWQNGSPARSPHDLECKLARLLASLEHTDTHLAQAQTAAA
jgi:hypothetical protein